MCVCSIFKKQNKTKTKPPKVFLFNIYFPNRNHGELKII